MGNVLYYRHVIALRNLGFIEEDVLDRVRNPDLLAFTTSIDSEKGERQAHKKTLHTTITT